MQEEKIKQIVSLYTKIPADQVDFATRLDRTAIASSIMIHRMYADLAKEGLEVAGYWDIRDYSMLLKRLGGEDALAGNGTQTLRLPASIIQKSNLLTDTSPLGIDIEDTGNMPLASNFREDKFYAKNFSPSEISYCIIQPAPLVSFAGLFAAKEAIIKANNNYKYLPFNNIVIDHLPGGKPIHPDFYLSITHTANLAVAVALQKNIPLPYPPIEAREPNVSTPNTTLLYVISFSAIILALITLMAVILR